MRNIIFYISVFSLVACSEKKSYSIKKIDKSDTIKKEIVLDFPQNDLDSGKTIFMRYCAACHSFEKDYSGPALNDKIDINKFEESVTNFDKLSKESLHAALLLYRYGYTMPSFKGILTPNQINFVKSYSIWRMQHKSCTH